MLPRVRPLAALLLLPLVACNVSATGTSTGGIGDAGSDAGASCPRGAVAVLTDYMSTQIALLSLQGVVQSKDFLSTASTMASGVAFALSGDVVLPHTPPVSGRVVLIDQYGSNVITWADPATAKVYAQLPIGTGFESNPYDYLETGATTAYVTRWGNNLKPGQQAFDTGSDVLVLDTQKPAITKSIAMPVVDSLPPCPAGMIQVGSTVMVVLQRLSNDYSTQGDAMLVGVQNEAVAWQSTLTGLKNCDHPTLSPSGKTMALACEGEISSAGTVMNASASALALYDVTALPPKLVKTFPIADQLGSTIQSGVAWVSETEILAKTQTPQMGTTNNQAFVLDVTTGKATVLLTAHPDAMGQGKGIVYGDVLCGPGCGNVCMMADADLGVVQRWSITPAAATGLTAMSPITVDSTTGLPPALLEGY
jgi:hypothetical protein